MKSDNLYSQMLDVKDTTKKVKTSRNLYAAAATVCTAASIFAFSKVGTANYLAASLGTGTLFAAGATISFYKLDKKLERISDLKRELINLRHEYERQRLIETQDFHKRIRSKSPKTVA